MCFVEGERRRTVYGDGQGKKGCNSNGTDTQGVCMVRDREKRSMYGRDQTRGMLVWNKQTRGMYGREQTNKGYVW